MAKEVFTYKKDKNKKNHRTEVSNSDKTKYLLEELEKRISEGVPCADDFYSLSTEKMNLVLDLQSEGCLLVYNGKIKINKKKSGSVYTSSEPRRNR